MKKMLIPVVVLISTILLTACNVEDPDLLEPIEPPHETQADYQSEDNENVGELTTLAPGDWTVGVDLPAGRYVFTGTGIGIIRVSRGSINPVSENFGGIMGVSSVTTDLFDGDEIEISGIRNATFTPVIDRELSNQLSAGDWTVGLDIEPGRYNVTAPDGSGNFSVRRGNETITNEILNQTQHIIRVQLEDGDTIWIGGLNTVDFTPR